MPVQRRASETSPGPAAGRPSWSRELARATERDGLTAHERGVLAGLLERGFYRGETASGRVAEAVDDLAHWRLYRRSRAGDARAAARFERAWRQQAACILGGRFTPAEIEELTAQFFVRVYDRVGAGFAWPCPFAHYLRTILVNLSRDHVRRAVRRRRRETPLDRADGAAREWEDPRAPDPEAEVVRGERSKALQEALWELGPTDRHVLVACLLRDEAGQDVAARLGISRDALYQRLHRAKARFRRVLEARGLT